MAEYRFPRGLAARVLWSVVTRRPRSFSRDAQLAIATLVPALQVHGAQCVPAAGPCLVTCNHYHRPGFPTWWLALAISSAVATSRAPGSDTDLHWLMTAAWTYPNSRWKRAVLTPATRWAFGCVARTYGFATMPPMPPQPEEVQARAAAVLRTIRLARRLVPRGGMLALAPEGQDLPGRLGAAPPGAGAFIALLVREGFPILPVGVAEEAGRLCVSFGPLYSPEVPEDRLSRDATVAQQVMAAIGRLL